MVDQVAADMMKSGVAVASWISHFVFAPPLIIQKSEIDAAIAAFDKALAIADSAVED